MNLPKELTTVTLLSKYLAMLVFIILPIVGFFLGIRYQEMIDSKKQSEHSVIPISLPTETQVLEGDETANWQTYRNDEFGFEVKYPSSWYLLEQMADRPSQNSPDNIFFSPGKITVNADSEGPFVPIVITIYFEEGQGLDINKHIESAQKARENPDIKKIVLGGKTFTKISGILKDNTYLSGKFSSLALREEKGIVIAVLYTGIGEVEPEIFDQILSTFKFIQ